VAHTLGRLFGAYLPRTTLAKESQLLSHRLSRVVESLYASGQRGVALPRGFGEFSASYSVQNKGVAVKAFGDTRRSNIGESSHTVNA
jgi:hypothetical protein